VTKVEPLQQDSQRPESGQPEQVPSTRVMNVGANPVADSGRAPRRVESDRRDLHNRAQSQSAHPSMMTYVLLTAVSLACGVIGAMGYAHFLGPQPGEPSSSQSQTGSNKASGSTKTSAGSGTKSANQTSTNESASDAAIESSQEAGDLKQQIVNLNKRIDRLGERVDRLQELLSLAVPLLQRLAPKQ
jgi:hypothetical protein